VVGSGSNALVSAARTGDQAAWGQLYELHAGRLVVWLRWLPSLDAASSPEDIAAHAWLTAASKLGEFRGSDNDFGGWLFGIARRHAANHCRRGARRRTSPVEDVNSDEPLFGVASDELGRVVDRDTIRRLMAELSPREAEVLACVDIVGLDVRSAAEALHMKPTAVRVARHRGLNRMRRLLDESGARTPLRQELGQAPR
jgi:RNA polymerase sigma-70 factor (ECF subfamily)